MRAQAALYYLWHKYRHETTYDNYHMDMLRISAASKIKNPDSLPRYSELIRPQKQYKQLKSGEYAVNKVYDVNDVVDMFAGKGRLIS